MRFYPEMAQFSICAVLQYHLCTDVNINIKQQHKPHFPSAFNCVYNSQYFRCAFSFLEVVMFTIKALLSPWLTRQQTCHSLFYEILIEEQLLHVCKVEPSPQTTQPLFSKSWTEGAWNAVNHAEYFYTLYPRHWFDLGLLNYDQMHKSNFGVSTNIIIIIKTWLFIDFGNSTNYVIKHNLQFKMGLNNHKPQFKKGMSSGF